MEEKKPRITFAKVTALLCALVILASALVFLNSDATTAIEYCNSSIKMKEASIAENAELIAQQQENIATYQQEKASAEASLPAATAAVEAATTEVATAQRDLTKAENNLDAVCWRSYYSSWSCSETCRPLHSAVTAKDDALEKANDKLTACKDTVYDINQQIENYDYLIAEAEDNIENAQARIRQLEVEISEIKSELAGHWFVLILKSLGFLLAIGGLGLFVKSFYTETVDNFTLYGCFGLAAASLLFFISGAINNPVWKNTALLYILTSPHAWNIAIMALFCVVLMNKTEKPVLLRNIAVVFAVIVLLLAVASGNALVCVLYVAATICTAFVIVPLVFTQYINIAKHIFLSLITFGIWQLVWTYHVTKNLNEVPGVEARRPAIELLLCMFLPFYYPYWLYKTAESVEAYGKENGKEFKLDILCIAFAFVCPLFATVLIQNKINVIVGKPE